MRSMKSQLHHDRVKAIQQALRETGSVDGWLFYDCRGTIPGYRILCSSTKHVRGLVLLVPAEGIRESY